MQQFYIYIAHPPRGTPPLGDKHFMSDISGRIILLNTRYNKTTGKSDVSFHFLFLKNSIYFISECLEMLRLTFLQKNSDRVTVFKSWWIKEWFSIFNFSYLMQFKLSHDPLSNTL